MRWYRRIPKSPDWDRLRPCPIIGCCHLEECDSRKNPRCSDIFLKEKKRNVCFNAICFIFLRTNNSVWPTISTQLQCVLVVLLGRTVTECVKVPELILSGLSLILDKLPAKVRPTVLYFFPPHFCTQVPSHLESWSSICRDWRHPCRKLFHFFVVIISSTCECLDF